MKKALLLGDGACARFHPLEPIEPIVSAIYSAVFDVEAARDYDALTLERLKQYDLVISYADDWDGRAGARSTAALMTYTADGGSLLGLHCGLIAPGRRDLSMLYGARFRGHPSQALLDYSAADAEHPVVKGLEAFKLTEEPYMFDFDAFAPTTVLMQYQYGQLTIPAAWCHRYGLGRVLCVSPGHSPESFYPPIRNLLYRAGLWLTDRL